MFKSSFGWVLMLAILAFAGRPLYICTMEQAVAEAPKPACHTEPEHAPAEHEAGCMLDATLSIAPAVEKAEISPAIPQLLAALSVVQVLSPAAPAPSLLADTAFASPPASITILRI